MAAVGEKMKEQKCAHFALTPTSSENYCISPLSIFTNGEGLRNKEYIVKELFDYMKARHLTT